MKQGQNKKKGIFYKIVAIALAGATFVGSIFAPSNTYSKKTSVESDLNQENDDFQPEDSSSKYKQYKQLLEKCDLVATNINNYPDLNEQLLGFVKKDSNYKYLSQGLDELDLLNENNNENIKDSDIVPNIKKCLIANEIIRFEENIKQELDNQNVNYTVRLKSGNTIYSNDKGTELDIASINVPDVDELDSVDVYINQTNSNENINYIIKKFKESVSIILNAKSENDTIRAFYTLTLADVCSKDSTMFLTLSKIVGYIYRGDNKEATAKDIQFGKENSDSKTGKNKITDVLHNTYKEREDELRLILKKSREISEFGQNSLGLKEFTKLDGINSFLKSNIQDKDVLERLGVINDIIKRNPVLLESLEVDDYHRIKVKEDYIWVNYQPLYDSKYIKPYNARDTIVDIEGLKFDLINRLINNLGAQLDTDIKIEISNDGKHFSEPENLMDIIKMETQREFRKENLGESLGNLYVKVTSERSITNPVLIEYVSELIERIIKSKTSSEIGKNLLCIEIAVNAMEDKEFAEKVKNYRDKDIEKLIKKQVEKVGIQIPKFNMYEAYSLQKGTRYAIFKKQLEVSPNTNDKYDTGNKNLHRSKRIWYELSDGTTVSFPETKSFKSITSKDGKEI